MGNSYPNPRVSEGRSDGSLCGALVKYPHVPEGTDVFMGLSRLAVIRGRFSFQSSSQVQIFPVYACTFVPLTIISINQICLRVPELAWTLDCFNAYYILFVSSYPRKLTRRYHSIV